MNKNNYIKAKKLHIASGRLCETGPDPETGICPQRRGPHRPRPAPAPLGQVLPVGAGLHLPPVQARRPLRGLVGQVQSGHRHQRRGLSHRAQQVAGERFIRS